MIVDPKNPNFEQLLVAAEKLASLLDQIVFVGGCVTGLLITDPGALPVRPSLDVDAIVEIASYPDFTLLEEQLRQLGFRESHAEGAPVCRWIHQDLILDLMPTDPSILGFSNRWYRPAFKNSQSLSTGTYQVQIITAPYFLATKLEAFHGRGKNDFRMSHDLEDIVTVVDGRAEIVNEVRHAQTELGQHLSAEFQALLSNRNFLEALPGHLLPDTASQQRLGLVVERIRELTI